MKIAFFWTPQFAADILSGIFTYDDIEVALVVSQPDKAVGRKKQIVPTQVKKIALENSIEVLQPAKLKDNQEFQQKLTDLQLDFIVVVAYGKIIPQSILDIPKYGCINIHGSILPLYRGASPVQSAIKDGHTETGLTIMYMDKKMDEGDILEIQKVAIDPDDTSIDLFQKFVKIGPELLISTLAKIVSRDIQAQPQNHDDATYCHMISKEDGWVDFKKQPAQDIYNMFRAYQPWPGVFCYIDEKKLILEDISLGEVSDQETWTFIRIDKKTYGVVCVDKKILLLHQVKPEWKKSMDIVSFMNGNRGILNIQ